MFSGRVCAAVSMKHTGTLKTGDGLVFQLCQIKVSSSIGTSVNCDDATTRVNSWSGYPQTMVSYGDERWPHRRGPESVVPV